MPRLDGNPNPQELSYEEIHAMIKFCPLCGTLWKEELFTCADPDCKTKLRVTPDAFNWWHFYPAINRFMVLAK
ncbi:MAG: hypothetical protein ACXAAO_13275 [Candidatus Thorarchaeota archaeon]|jgi:hypothetical protein